VAVKTWFILEPLPLLAPDAFVCDTVQLNVVPLMPFGFVTEIAVASPEQSEVVPEAETVGLGFTVTTDVTGDPAQPLAEGVMV
jgi:hypothetical protein